MVLVEDRASHFPLFPGSSRPLLGPPVPGLDTSTLALQQAFIHKQAVLLVSEAETAGEGGRW